jgi:competence protein ComGC
VAQAVECLLSKWKTLPVFNPSTTKKRSKSQDRGCSSVIEHLQSMCKAQVRSPALQTQQKNNKKVNFKAILEYNQKVTRANKTT